MDINSILQHLTEFVSMLGEVNDESVLLDLRVIANAFAIYGVAKLVPKPSPAAGFAALLLLCLFVGVQLVPSHWV